jgi:predicted metal-dependent enzyme (double-stranded beta helix superfamily)
MKFELDQFIADCRNAVREDPSYKAVREIVARAVADPAEVLRAVGEPTKGAIVPLYQSKELTVLNLVWAPNMYLLPHNHRMWAVIGIYTGREDNVFWRRVGDHPENIEAAGAKSLSAGDACPLGPDIIHSVINPIPRLTGAIHVYGGDFFGVERSEWDPEKLCECATSGEKMARRFDEANERWRASNQ